MTVTVVAGVAATVLSGWLFRLATALRPVAAAAWLAPVPPMLLAPRVPALAAAGVAAAAWCLGQLGLWSYFARELRQPPLLVAARIAGGGAGVAAVVTLARGQLLGGHPVLAALAVPAGWVALEFLVALRSVDGAVWSIAYSQAGHPAVLRIAALTGVWGVAALVVLPSGAAAVVAAPGGTAAGKTAVVLLGAAVVGLALAPRRRGAAGERVHVGLVAVAHAGGAVAVGTAQGAALLSRYVEQVRSVAARGAEVVVLPETVFAVDEDRLAEQLEPLAGAARDLGIQVVAGVAASANLAAVLGPGSPPVVYRKQHLVPVLEAAFRPGRERVHRPGGLGVLICKDLDFPGLVRAYRSGGARLLLAPAWDFGGDGWRHSRMAVVRGIESGLAVARVARDGRATISDASGRVLVDAGTEADTAVDAAVALGPARPTVYARLGDWFGWSCVAVTAGLVVAGLT